MTKKISIVDDYYKSKYVKGKVFINVKEDGEND